LGGLWALEWAWHFAETNLRCVRSLGICKPNLPRSQRSSGRTDRRTWLDRLGFVGSETLPSACYILSDESSIPFYSTSNGYNNCVSGFAKHYFLVREVAGKCRPEWTLSSRRRVAAAALVVAVEAVLRENAATRLQEILRVPRYYIFFIKRFLCLIRNQQQFPRNGWYLFC